MDNGRYCLAKVQECPTYQQNISVRSTRLSPELMNGTGMGLLVGSTTTMHRQAPTEEDGRGSDHFLQGPNGTV